MCFLQRFNNFEVQKKSSDKHFFWQTSETFLMVHTAGQLLLQIFAQIIINKNATL